MGPISNQGLKVFVVSDLGEEHIMTSKYDFPGVAQSVAADPLHNDDAFGTFPKATSIVSR